MSSRLCTHQKSIRQQTPDFSTAPAQGMFQSRPFVVQTHSAEKSQQQPDWKSALRRAERYGHNLLKMQPVRISDPKATEPKLEMRQSVELHRAKAPQRLQAKSHLEQAIVVQQSDRTLVGSASQPIQCANTVVDDATDPQNTVAPGSGRGLLQDSSGTVQPSVQFGPLRNDCGTYMHAVIHPTDDMGGTIPQAGTWPTWWAANKPSNPNYWVRGHLLNHNIGGPGDDKRNLTPITKKANSDHLKLIETAAKKASAKGWGLDYTVEAKYDAVGPTQLLGDHTDPNAAVWPYLTTGLLCKVGYAHMKSGKIFYDQPEFIENKR